MQQSDSLWLAVIISLPERGGRAHLCEARRWMCFEKVVGIERFDATGGASLYSVIT